MNVEESGVLDCFVEAGAELQSTALLLHELAHAGLDAARTSAGSVGKWRR